MFFRLIGSIAIFLSLSSCLNGAQDIEYQEINVDLVQVEGVQEGMSVWEAEVDLYDLPLRIHCSHNLTDGEGFSLLSFHGRNDLAFTMKEVGPGEYPNNIAILNHMMGEENSFLKNRFLLHVPGSDPGPIAVFVYHDGGIGPRNVLFLQLIDGWRLAMATDEQKAIGLAALHRGMRGVEEAMPDE